MKKKKSIWKCPFQKTLFYLICIICILPFCSAELIEVGSKNVSFLMPNTNSLLLQESGIQPSFSVSSLLGNTVPIKDFDLNYVVEQKQKALLVTHQIKPKIVLTPTWNPSENYYKIDSVLIDAGQYVEFYDDYNFHRWNYGDTNSLAFKRFGKVLLFNSWARNFSQEIDAGFIANKITIQNNVVSLWFSTNKTVLNPTEPLILQDLITHSEAICNSGDANVIWLEGNTYFINADSNVDVEDCMLTIQAGTIIKFKGTENATTDLNIVNKGILIAQGTQAKPIVFTSQNDNSIGAVATDSNGNPKRPDYFNAIRYSSTAGMIPDANNLFDLNISFAKQAIRNNGIALNSIHNCSFQDNNSQTLRGAGIITSGKISNIYDNNFSNNQSFFVGDQSSIIACVSNAKGIGDIYKNNFLNNKGGAIGISACNFGNIFDNNFTENESTAIIDFKSTSVGSFSGKGIFNNVFEEANYFAIIFSIDTGSFLLTNFYNNTFKNIGQKGIDFYGRRGGTEITNFYNNKFINSGTGIFISEGSSPELVINNFYNNLFVANNIGLQATGTTNAIINNMYNNLFAFNSTAGIAGSATNKIDSNFNAFFASPNILYKAGNQDYNLTTNPFINDGSDRNFLYNTNGIIEMQGRANSTIGTNSFFQSKTVRYDNRLDYNRSIGYHYDQNSPYLNIISLLTGSYAENVFLDFNISSIGSNANVTIDLNIFKQAEPDKNVFYLKQNYANWSCSQNLPSLTKDSNCTYIWATSACDYEDATYSFYFKAIDKNGLTISATGNYTLDNNICTVTITERKIILLSQINYDLILILIIILVCISLLYFLFSRKN